MTDIVPGAVYQPGYLSIRITYKNFFVEFIGESPDSGTSFPDIVQIATAYRLPACRIETADFSDTVDEVLKQEGPVLCEVILDPEQPFEPKTSSRQYSVIFNR